MKIIRTKAPAFTDRHVDLTGLTSYRGVKLATGCTVTKESLLREENCLDLREAGCVALEDRAEGDASTYAIANTRAVNEAIGRLNAMGGGTLVIPAGTFRVYTVCLRSRVNLCFEEGSCLQAARTDVWDEHGRQIMTAEDREPDGTPGNYLRPQANIFAGLQDNGHTYFENSMFFADGQEDIMLYGSGLIDGSQRDESGCVIPVLTGFDPPNPVNRSDRPTVWHGNKCLALVRCRRLVLSGLSILNGGHFAIITEDSRDMLLEGLTVDTVRDALDVDCGGDATILDSVFNSLTDDAIVFKASFGGGAYSPLSNCLVKNCTVSGYDAGSVLAGTFTGNKLVATDRCGPTARVKLGTESTCGYHTVTIDGVRFRRSRGFALEAVDGSDLRDIVFVNADMENISSSPVFMRIGNRGRFPVTGVSGSDAISPEKDVRLTNRGWVVPPAVSADYAPRAYYPAAPCLREELLPDGVRVTLPVATPNPVNAPIPAPEGVDPALLSGDAVAFARLPRLENVVIENVRVTDADPRYPMLIAGLTDSPVRNVTVEHMSVTWRGGIRMRDAVEQRRLDTRWRYTQQGTAAQLQSPPWLVNTFFTQHAALLPRVAWKEAGWQPEPFAVPEMPEQYPEPSNFGILPAYGLYMRHAEGIRLTDVTMGLMVEDERHALVLDDVHDLTLEGVTAEMMPGVAQAVTVSRRYVRPTGCEYVPEYPYHATDCSGLSGLESLTCEAHTVACPEPGVQPDSLWTGPTVANADNGFAYGETVWQYGDRRYPLPVTVYRPFFDWLPDPAVRVGETLTLTPVLRCPAQTEGGEDAGIPDDIRCGVTGLPEGAAFDEQACTLTWTPDRPGRFELTFTAEDGVLPVERKVTVTVHA